MLDDAFVPERLSTLVSLLLVIAVDAAFIAFFAVALYIRRDTHRRLARLAAIPDEGAPSPGRRTLRGTVTTTAGGVAAVTIDVVQRADVSRRERQRDDLPALWVETSRTVDAKPFYLELDSGELVFVEPGPDVTLVLEPTAIVKRGDEERVCRLELAAGGKVSITGVIEVGTNPRGAQAGYRDEARGFVMRASVDEPLTIAAATFRSLKRVSTRPLDFPLYVLALIAVQVLFFGPFYLLGVDGHVEVATVTKVSREIVKEKNREFFDYQLTAKGSAGTVLTDETTAEAYEHRDDVPPPRVPFVVSRHFPLVHQIGSSPRIYGLFAAFAFVLALVLSVASIVRLPQSPNAPRVVSEK